MNCNSILSADRWEFVKDFVEDFVAILVAIYFATPFATKIFVKKSLKFCQRFCCFNSSLTKFQRSFGRKFDIFLWQNVLPQHFATKKIVEISSKISLLQFKFWQNSDKKILWQNILPQSTRRKVWRNSDETKTKETTKKILIPENIASGRKSWWSSITIYIYAVYCESSCLIYIYVDTFHCIKLNALRLHCIVLYRFTCHEWQ